MASLGFVDVRQRGPHKQFRHPGGRGTTVPDHGGRGIASVLIRQIAKYIGLAAEDFIALR